MNVSIMRTFWTNVNFFLKILEEPSELLSFAVGTMLSLYQPYHLQMKLVKQ